MRSSSRWRHRAFLVSSASLLWLHLLVPLALGQGGIISGKVRDLFNTHCASCHSEDGSGGLGGSLIDNEWRFGGSDAEVTRLIREGNADLGMPAFGATLSDREIRSLVVFLRELKLVADRTASETSKPPADGDVVMSELHHFRIERVVELADAMPWSVDFLPDDAMLVSGIDGRVFVVRDGKLGEPVRGTPEVWRHGQGGLLDVVVHPGYEQNGWIYLSYAESRDAGKTGATKIVRGRIANGAWTDEELVFEVPQAMHSGAGVHFGCRIVFRNEHLFFSIGDRGQMENAQRLDNPFGKIHRVLHDGSIPTDNPFHSKPEAFPTIYSYGNRNAQGLVVHPLSNMLWATEHGPRGGDELNWIRPGQNYGWPKTSYGINYNGEPITSLTEAPGITPPATYWTPSIAVCGMDVIVGKAFPAWRGHILVGGLASQQVRRIEVDESGRVLADELLLKGLGRVRDICTGPDGIPYLAINHNKESGAIYRLAPITNPSPEK